MKPLAAMIAVVVSFAPSLALACPYASSATGSLGCTTCGSSLFSYGTWLLLGLGIGIGSVAFERKS